jgi:GNAT superfamily N-acetyltransferase
MTPSPINDQRCEDQKIDPPWVGKETQWLHCEILSDEAWPRLPAISGSYFDGLNMDELTVRCEGSGDLYFLALEGLGFFLVVQLVDQLVCRFQDIRTTILDDHSFQSLAGRLRLRRTRGTGLRRRLIRLLFRLAFGKGYRLRLWLLYRLGRLKLCPSDEWRAQHFRTDRWRRFRPHILLCDG